MKKTILLTGSEGQLGKIFFNFLKKYFNIISLDRFEPSLIKKKNYYQVDFDSPLKLKLALSKIKKKFNKIDILVNNAGEQVFSKFEKRTLSEIYKVLNVNVVGNILLSQFVFNNYFKKKSKGIIVNVGSIYGLVAGDMSLYNKNDRKTSEIYGASKAAVIHLTKYLANYMGKFNVRVNCISPGGVLNKKLQKKNFIKKYSRKTSLGRMANSKEILNTLIFLLNEDSDYITGQNLIVDGGYTLT